MSISHNNFLIHRPPDAAAADCGHRPVRSREEWYRCIWPLESSSRKASRYFINSSASRIISGASFFRRLFVM